MRTYDEILSRCENSDDTFGFTSDVLARYLPSEYASKLFTDGADLTSWTPLKNDRETIISEMREYMEFAWDKALNHRGLSSSRSVIKMCAWLWLLEDEDLLTYANDNSNYPMYGAPILKAICEKYGFDIPDDPKLVLMSKGEPCSPHCQEGCLS